MQELYKCIFRSECNLEDTHFIIDSNLILVDKNFGLPLEFIASRAAEKGAPQAVPIIITKSIDFLRKKGS